MSVSVQANQKQILGAALVDLLNGELTDETIAAIDSIKREDVEGPLNNLVGMMHGMTTLPRLRQDIIGMLVGEIHSATLEVMEKRREGPSPISTDWIVMYNILEAILEGGEYDIRANADVNVEAGLDVPSVDRSPAWAAPLIKHINASKSKGDDLTLELLAELESMIKARRDKLVEPTL